MTALGVIMNFITRVCSLELLGSQWCEKYKNVAHCIVLPNIQTKKDLLSLSDMEASGWWVFEQLPASQSAAILGENANLKTLHLPIQRENSHKCLPTLGYDLPVQIICWNIWQEKEKSYQYVSKIMHAYYLSFLMKTSWEINCLANVIIRSTGVGVNTLLMSEKLNLALFFLNDHNVQYTKSWLEIAMYLFAYLAYANIWMQENMIEVKYRVTLLSAAFVHSVMPFCKPVTDSRVSQ